MTRRGRFFLVWELVEPRPRDPEHLDSQCTPVHGVLESHQLSSGKSPLLLSLHAQAHLGLVKDLKHGTISIDGNQLPV